MLIYAVLYLAFCVFGVAMSMYSAGTTVISAVAATAATITALFASLLVPFAAFANNEKWNRIILQYVPVCLLGFYMGTMLHEHSYMICIELALATAIHVGYWFSSVQSRAYRLEQFKLGLAKEMPSVARLVALLNGRGLAHKADDILKAVFSAGTLDWRPIEQEFEIGQCWLFDKVVEELAPYCSQSGPKRIDNHP